MLILLIRKNMASETIEVLEGNKQEKQLQE